MEIKPEPALDLLCVIKDDPLATDGKQ